MRSHTLNTSFFIYSLLKVFLHISIAVQYRVLCNKTFDAHYRLTNPHIQIKSYVYDVVRSAVPRMELDEVFLSKSDIALSIRTSLYSFMQEYGYEILDALVIDLSPNDKIKASMNEINASKRMKEACIHKAESGKLVKLFIIYIILLGFVLVSS